VPKGRERKTDLEWARWFDTTAEMAIIVEKAASRYECGRYGYSTAGKRRRARKAEFNRVEAAKKRDGRLHDIHEKAKRGRKVTNADRALLSDSREAGKALARLSNKLPEEYRETTRGPA